MKDTTQSRLDNALTIGGFVLAGTVIAAMGALAVTAEIDYHVKRVERALTLPTPAPRPSATPTPTPEPSAPAGIPQCSDAIANAGGICWGPLIEDVPAEQPVVPASPASVTEPPVDLPDPVEHFEDGSWLNHDTGEQGCDPTGSCAALPPVPEGTPTTPNGGYYPTLTLEACPTEDAEDCYWDAARMGNGEGRSFIRVDGITFYAEAGA